MKKDSPWYIKNHHIALCPMVEACLSKSVDKAFLRLMAQNKYETVPGGRFGYLPWVGKDYSSFQNRLFVVGESYYKDNENPKYDEYGRAVIADWMCFESYIDTYVKLFKAILPVSGDEEKHRESIASSVVYFNLIQRCLMTPEGKDSPDFVNGWVSFLEAVEILRPTLCVFNGVASKAHSQLHRGIAKAEETLGISVKFTEERLILADKEINNCFTHPVVKLKVDTQEPISLLWIKHSCRAFSPDKWNKGFLLHSKEFAEWDKEINARFPKWQTL